jgi:inorganic triphosphatase YgiF
MAEGDAQREVELKLELPESSVRKVLRHRSLERYGDGPVLTQRLLSTYFDTVDRALQHAGLSLRIREIGAHDPPQRVQTLKAGERSRGGLFQRWEDEVEVERDLPEVEAVSDPTLRGTLQRALSGRTLRPLFVTDVQRSQRRMRVAGDVWSVDLDVGQVRAGNLSESLCELELELIKGHAVRLYDMALGLLDDIPLTPGFVSKSARGFALAEGKRAVQPLGEALERMREALPLASDEKRPVFERELALLEKELARVRREQDLAALHHSPRFARVALELGRLVAAG